MVYRIAEIAKIRGAVVLLMLGFALEVDATVGATLIGLGVVPMLAT